VSEAVPERRARDARVSLGVPELDQMLEGGLMSHRPYLIVGPAGTGKTTLALQFLCEGIRRGERGLYVTLEDPPNEVRWNHRALRPELDAVEVFDAIPDVMRYERVPFKDISAVRQTTPFGKVPDRIRLTPEFSSVEVTGTALEQMLRGEVQKRGYSRLVIDSLTALQYFCMKGFDPTVGAQTFLRFLTELRTTTVLTVEAPLEDIETPERMLARGEVRLFRWELDGTTVRAVGVEKFRGSAHDVRLHPYRIGSRGIDVQLAQTISRDTRRIVEPAIDVALRGEAAAAPALTLAPPAAPPAAPAPEPLSQQIGDLVTLGVDVAPLRSEVQATLEALRGSRSAEVTARLTRIAAMAISLAPLEASLPRPGTPTQGPAGEAFRRVIARADRSRVGIPPTQLPPPELLARELSAILTMIPAPAALPAAAPAAQVPVAAPAPSPPPSAPAPPAAFAPAPAPTPSPPAASPGPLRTPAPASVPMGPAASAPSPAAVSPRPATAPPSSPAARAPPAPASAPGPPELPRVTVPPPDATSASAHAVARAAALLGEPTSRASEPEGTSRSPPPTGGRPSAGHPTAPSVARPPRSAPVSPTPAPPPLPTVVRLPSPAEPPRRPPIRQASVEVVASALGAAPAPAEVLPTAGAPPPAAVAGADMPAAPAPRRRRKTAAAKPTPTVVPGDAAGTSVDAGGPTASGAAPKPRRRAVRRKKAPPVVATSVDLTPPAASPTPPPPASTSPPAESSPAKETP
jgi:KaiC/GvpD/RAD55 family RecA-like ATPase